jgi:site-specific recombinase XerD
VGKHFHDVRTAFDNAMTKAGITGFRFHDLRHTAASHMVMAGVDMKTVGKIIGHTTTTTTERYSHLTPEHMRGAIEKLSAAYSGATCYKSATNGKGATG